ncbi:MAG: DUF559 domain-containing protein [Nocardioidaceae bacterium]
MGRDFWVQPDLVDPARRVVAEADSFAWHGSRSALREDAQRYNNLVVRGWRVLRFSWEDVMHDPAYVRRTLRRSPARSRRLERPSRVGAWLTCDPCATPTSRTCWPSTMPT